MREKEMAFEHWVLTEEERDFVDEEFRFKFPGPSKRPLWPRRLLIDREKKILLVGAGGGEFDMPVFYYLVIQQWFCLVEGEESKTEKERMILHRAIVNEQVRNIFSDSELTELIQEGIKMFRKEVISKDIDVNTDSFRIYTISKESDFTKFWDPVDNHVLERMIERF